MTATYCDNEESGGLRCCGIPHKPHQNQVLDDTLLFQPESQFVRVRGTPLQFYVIICVGRPDVVESRAVR